METQEFKLTNATMELLFNYLIDRPYKEVAELIARMQTDVQNNTKIEREDERIKGKGLRIRSQSFYFFFIYTIVYICSKLNI